MICLQSRRTMRRQCSSKLSRNQNHADATSSREAAQPRARDPAAVICQRTLKGYE